MGSSRDIGKNRCNGGLGFDSANVNTSLPVIIGIPNSKSLMTPYEVVERDLN